LVSYFYYKLIAIFYNKAIRAEVAIHTKNKTASIDIVILNPPVTFKKLNGKVLFMDKGQDIKYYLIAM